MSSHLHREMENLKRSAVGMCAHVEQNVRDAALAFLERDVDLAKRVIDADAAIDGMEVELTENCLKTLALYQPVAGDLRFIFSLAKISGILERIGDLAENLARKGRTLARLEAVAAPPEIAEMAERAGRMLTESIDSLVAGDAEQARGVIVSDEEVNTRKRAVRRAAETAIMAKPEHCRQWLAVVAASRNIERMADMAANIAAEVIYGVDGRMTRHGLDHE